MRKRTWLLVFGAVLLLGAASVVSGAARPGTAQSTSATSKKKKSSKSKRKAKVKGQTTPAPDRIREIQEALQKDGSYQGDPTGKWDDATTEAMKKYQDKNGFPVTGKIDALSLNKLGLGAETAGKAAPVPSATATPAPPAAATPVTDTSPSSADPATKEQ